MAKDTTEINPNAAAGIGFLFALPFIFMNFVISLRLEPLYSFIGSFPMVRTSTTTPLLLILLFPIGAFIALRPIFKKRADGTRKIYMLNIILAVLLVAAFLILFSALAEDFYRCDVLQIPNCD